MQDSLKVNRNVQKTFCNSMYFWNDRRMSTGSASHVVEGSSTLYQCILNSTDSTPLKMPKSKNKTRNCGKCSHRHTPSTRRNTTCHLCSNDISWYIWWMWITETFPYYPYRSTTMYHLLDQYEYPLEGCMLYCPNPTTNVKHSSLVSKSREPRIWIDGPVAGILFKTKDGIFCFCANSQQIWLSPARAD